MFIPVLAEGAPKSPVVLRKTQTPAQSSNRNASSLDVIEVAPFTERKAVIVSVRCLAVWGEPCGLYLHEKQR